MRLTNYLCRLRHNKGFGIHSPFAFSLIRDIVGAPGHYYSDYQLYHLVGRRGSSRISRLTWLIHRLTARLDPQMVVMPEDLPEQLSTAVQLARTTLRPTAKLPRELPRDTMLICRAKWMMLHEDDVQSVYKQIGNIVVVLCGNHDVENIANVASESMPGGWALTDNDVAVFISSDKTPYLRYDVKLL